MQTFLKIIAYQKVTRADLGCKIRHRVKRSPRHNDRSFKILDLTQFLLLVLVMKYVLKNRITIADVDRRNIPIMFANLFDLNKVSYHIHLIYSHIYLFKCVFFFVKKTYFRYISCISYL